MLNAAKHPKLTAIATTSLTGRDFATLLSAQSWQWQEPPNRTESGFSAVRIFARRAANSTAS
jgi:hypothetical protein